MLCCFIIVDQFDLEQIIPSPEASRYRRIGSKLAGLEGYSNTHQTKATPVGRQIHFIKPAAANPSGFGLFNSQLCESAIRV